MKLTPKKLAGGNGFGIAFRHPLHDGKYCRRGLGTTDETTAWAICRDILALLENAALLQEPDSPKLLAYERRAVQIVIGEEHAANVFGNRSDRAAFTTADFREHCDDQTRKIKKCSRLTAF